MKEILKDLVDLMKVVIYRGTYRGLKTTALMLIFGITAWGASALVAPNRKLQLPPDFQLWWLALPFIGVLGMHVFLNLFVWVIALPCEKDKDEDYEMAV